MFFDSIKNKTGLPNRIQDYAALVKKFKSP